MALVTNTHTRFDLDSTFEDLSNRIYNTDPLDTTVLSMLKWEKSSNIVTEWSVDGLSTPTDNASIPGDVFTPKALDSATKLGNTHQRSRIDFAVDTRADLVSTPGRRQESAYQVMKEMMTLKNGVEMSILTRKIGLSGSNTVAPQTAGIPAWIRTHANMGASGGSAPTLTTGSPAFPTTAGTLGTVRGLKESDILSLKADIYRNQKDEANMLVLPVQVKQSLSSYLMANDSARVATPYQDMQGAKGDMATVMGAVQYWKTDFGTIKMIPSRHIPQNTTTSEVLLLNPKFWSVSFMQGFVAKSQPTGGDDTRKSLFVDFTVKAKNENSSACIAAINDETAVAA